MRARSFGGVADAYERGRPGYPALPDWRMTGFLLLRARMEGSVEIRPQNSHIYTR